MAWRIEYSSEAIIALRRIPANTSRTIRGKIERLANDPFAPNNNVKALKGRPGFRLRIGDWRVIYELHGSVLVVEVLAIGPRGNVYD
ncbi:MAG: type II toxin-antitoxin system RelE/ParE family toxin [Rhodospirillales bacterium]|nr:MAG: type II toxin-antitoxin system RelE/ParE family toxin [Rhodospirillales bacterium]